jgi:hypothetical protein
MNEVSNWSNPMTSPDFLNAISSPGLEDGVLRSGLPAGLKTEKSGPEAAPVSRSLLQVKEKVKQTPGTCGPSYDASSPSAVLQLCLESRLLKRLEDFGSMEYALTWKVWDMQSGPPICALRASVRRTSASGSTGWPTPQERDYKGAPGVGCQERGGHQSSLPAVTGWCSPASRDWKDSAGMATTGTNPDGSVRSRVDQLPRQAQLAGWGTPRVSSSRGNGNPSRSADGMARLEDQVHGVDLSGVTSDSPTAETEKRGALNPAFSAWLQGYPKAWCEAAILAHRSMRKVPQKRG